MNIFGHPTLEAPAFTNRELNSVVDIQFGPAYIFAMAAHDIPKGVDWQDLELARSPKIHGFADKVTYQAHPEFGTKMTSMVEVNARGTTFREEKKFIDVHQPTSEELIAKFRHNAARILTEPQINNAVDTILGLEQVDNISELMKQITI